MARKISTSDPDGEIHHVEDVKCITESQRHRNKEVAPEALLQVAECIQRKKEGSSVDVLLMLCASNTWAQVGDRW